MPGNGHMERGKVITLYHKSGISTFSYLKTSSDFDPQHVDKFSLLLRGYRHGNLQEKAAVTGGGAGRQLQGKQGESLTSEWREQIQTW